MASLTIMCVQFTFGKLHPNKKGWFCEEENTCKVHFQSKAFYSSLGKLIKCCLVTTLLHQYLQKYSI